MIYLFSTEICHYFYSDSVYVHEYKTNSYTVMYIWGDNVRCGHTPKFEYSLPSEIVTVSESMNSHKDLMNTINKYIMLRIIENSEL